MGVSSVATAVMGAGVIKASGALDAELQANIDTALAECAPQARLEVMARYFGNRGPTQEECAEQVGTDSQGRPVTRAMRLGEEQHHVALKCAEEKLKRLKPGGFSLMPRYRVNPQSAGAEYIPQEEVQVLLQQGRHAELRGTIEPDIVIHQQGKPHEVQDVYDFKFPCVNTGKVSPWRRYPTGHPYEDSNQGQVYARALGGTPARVQPHVGVVR